VAGFESGSISGISFPRFRSFVLSEPYCATINAVDPEHLMRRMISSLGMLLALALACALPAHGLSWESTMHNSTVLAFGDSLTHGMWVTNSYSRGHHPYSLQLQKRFTEAGVTAAVLEKGIDGEQASRMLMRLPTQLSLLADVKFVVILGGTNDLHRAKDRTGAAILRHVVRLHQIVQHEARSRKTQIYTVAVGVPEISGWGNVMEERQALNRGLQDYAAQCGESVVYVDWEVGTTDCLVLLSSYRIMQLFFVLLSYHVTVLLSYRLIALLSHCLIVLSHQLSHRLIL
jgi:lysophospholipase L1-like esterase